jgi:hypothetical protein
LVKEFAVNVRVLAAQYAPSKRFLVLTGCSAAILILALMLYRRTPVGAIAIFGAGLAGIFFAFAITNLRATVLNASIAVAALGTADFVLWRASYEGNGNYFENGDSLERTAHAELGYALARREALVRNIRRRPDGSLIYDVRYRIDAKGLRVTPGPPAGEAEQPVFLFGDSFAFGEGVNDGETLAAHLAQKAGRPVVNFGVGGYGPHQFLRMLETKHAEALGFGARRPQAVVFTFITDHVDRSAGRVMWDQRGPYYDLVGNQLQHLGTFADAKWRYPVRWLREQAYTRSHAMRLLLKAGQRLWGGELADRRRILEIFKKANAIVNERYGAPLVVVIWDVGAPQYPQKDPDRADWLLEQLLAAGVKAISLRRSGGPTRREHYVLDDGHPSGAGHGVAAGIIAETAELSTPG